jgi:hypothetical protein
MGGCGQIIRYLFTHLFSDRYREGIKLGNRQSEDVIILDADQNAGAAKISTAFWIDYLQLTK